MELNSKITIFECGINEGVFSQHKKFYAPNSTKSEIRRQFDVVKKRCGEHFGFDDKKVFQAKQKNDQNKIEYPNGKYIVLEDKHMHKDDFWDEELPADILILKEQYKGIVVGNQMADCPILIVEDRKQGVTALSHCGASYIDRELPKDTIKALQKEFNSSIDDLYVYVGTCAKKESYVYDTYPRWANNEYMWKDNIEEKQDGFHIDMNGAIRIQLEQLGIKHIEESPRNTITDDKYYSHYSSVRGNNKKLGQNFVGFFYN